MDNANHNADRRSVSLFVLLSVTVMVIWGTAPAVLAADTLYQCVPSGFSVSIYPFRVPSNYAQSIEERPAISLDAMREQLGMRLSRTQLFSRIFLLSDESVADSSDLSLLVTFPVLQGTTNDVYPSYEMGIEVLLVDNLSGQSLFDRHYSHRFSSSYPKGVRKTDEYNADILIGFTDFLTTMIKDLDQALNGFPDPLFKELRSQKMVVHSHLEPLWFAPVIVVNKSPALENYSKYVLEQIHERLSRKNCFQFPDTSVQVMDCLRQALNDTTERVIGEFQDCVEGLDGMVASITLSEGASGYNVRARLFVVPGMTKLYDRTLTTAPGWRLANTIEAHAAGIAQASHLIPH